jgi:F0F1-type ATP synthase gamma subunit
MPLRESLYNDLADLSALGAVTSALTETSVRKIVDVRAAFERSVPFYRRVHELYTIVRFRAEREGPRVRRERGGGTVAIGLTSNHRFHGEMDRAVARMLVERIPAGGHAFIVGRIGRGLIKQLGFERRVQLLVFNDDIPAAAELLSFLERMEVYDRILLFHPSFVNLLTQRVVETEIGGDVQPASSAGARESGGEAISEEAVEGTYIFEPELAELALFFETEVRRYLFGRVFFEAELARTAARLVAMSAAERMIASRMRAVRIALRKVDFAAETLRTLETFAGIIAGKRMEARAEVM